MPFSGLSRACDRIEYDVTLMRVTNNLVTSPLSNNINTVRILVFSTTFGIVCFFGCFTSNIKSFTLFNKYETGFYYKRLITRFCKLNCDRCT